MEILIKHYCKKDENVVIVNVNKFDNYKFFYLTSKIMTLVKLQHM